MVPCDISTGGRATLDVPRGTTVSRGKNVVRHRAVPHIGFRRDSWAGGHPTASAASSHLCREGMHCYMSRSQSRRTSAMPRRTPGAGRGIVPRGTHLARCGAAHGTGPEQPCARNHGAFRALIHTYNAWSTSDVPRGTSLYAKASPVTDLHCRTGRGSIAGALCGSRLPVALPSPEQMN
jgi:hypothetical protein